jgi:phosphatidylglycerol:prolipoprotein diacylglycerol transferase
MRRRDSGGSLRPILFQLGQFPVRSYGLMMALAFIVGILVARRRARAAGLDPDVIIDFAFFVILASIAGARAVHVIVQWDYYRADPLSIFRIWEGGLAQYGGIAAGVVTGMIFFVRRHIDPWMGSDVVAPSVALGVAIGRIGCFLNGCCYGKACSLPWAVTFPPSSIAGQHVHGAALHPTQIYESLAALVIFFVLIAVDRRKPFYGFTLWLLIILLAAYRFLIDPIRQYEATAMVFQGPRFALTANQAIGIALIAISVGFMVFLGKRGSRPDRTPRRS